ncbi:unnamed protein product [Camellia sinensis]
MLKMVWLSLLFFLSSLHSLTGASQESIEHLTLHDPSPMVLQSLSHTGVPVGVSVSSDRLSEISNSVIVAETWLRTHVLAHYPATKITTIVVGHTVLCNANQQHHMGLILPSVKNIYHSLTRWGLEKEINVSPSFSSNCLNPSSATYRDDLAENFIKPLLTFSQFTNSPYLVNPPPHFSPSPEETLSLVSSHTESMKNLGFFDLNRINVLITSQKQSKHINRKRKLSFMDSMVAESILVKPIPLAPAPVPAFEANSPLPPFLGKSSPPPFSLNFAPKLAPIVSPGSPNLPPCNPSYTGAPTPPGVGGKSELWCVAKPSVPAETLQEAMDYACGEGGADCEEIKPPGNCYHPDTIVAHASYAFNSYWQKHRKIGGTCSFGGTAMLINADPIVHSKLSQRVER